VLKIFKFSAFVGDNANKGKETLIFLIRKLQATSEKDVSYLLVKIIK